MRALSLTIACIIMITPGAWSQSDASRTKNFNLKKTLAIEGYDPVSYFSNKPLQGKEEVALEYKGARYLFATEANRNKFKSDPEKYEPAYGGWCAYAMGESGEKVKVDPETFKLTGGKLYLFYNFWGNNTLSGWNKDEKGLMLKADQHWKKIIQ